MNQPFSPTVTLHNGTAMPLVGLGTCRASEGEAYDAVLGALQQGYRLIDTASIYGNEVEVGRAIRDSGIPREEITLTSKLWISDYGADGARRGCAATLARLGLAYVDLYLLHWPDPENFATTVATWETLVDLQREGSIRAVGVANFRPEDLAALRKESDVAPVINQVELHPYLTQHHLRAADEEFSIVTQAWAPLGGPPAADRSAATRQLLDEPAITRLALDLGATPAQVVLAWHLHHGVSVVPKSSNPGRQRENAAATQLVLSTDQVAQIDALNRDWRGGEDPALVSTATNQGVVDNSILG